MSLRKRPKHSFAHLSYQTGIEFIESLMEKYGKTSVEQLIPFGHFIRTIMWHKDRCENIMSIFNRDAYPHEAHRIKLIDNVLKTVENPPVCNKRGHFLDCTCNHVGSANFKMCDVCLNRKQNAPLDSNSAGPSKCRCAYCMVSSGEWIEHLEKRANDRNCMCHCDSLSESLYTTWLWSENTSLIFMCETCWLYLGVDFLK
jgi:hypothetical protein